MINIGCKKKLFCVCILCISLIFVAFYAIPYLFCKTIKLGQYNGTDIGSIKVETLWIHECHDLCLIGVLSPNRQVHYALIPYLGKTQLDDIEDMSELPSDIFSECEVWDYYNEKLSYSEYKIIKANISALNNTLKDFQHQEVISEYSTEFIWSNNKYVQFSTSYVDGKFKTDEQDSSWVDVVHGDDPVEMSNISYFFVHKLLNSERWSEENDDIEDARCNYVKLLFHT